MAIASSTRPGSVEQLLQGGRESHGGNEGRDSGERAVCRAQSMPGTTQRRHILWEYAFEKWNHEIRREDGRTEPCALEGMVKLQTMWSAAAVEACGLSMEPLLLLALVGEEARRLWSCRMLQDPGWLA